LPTSAQAEAVALTLPARGSAEQGQSAGRLVHLPRPEHGVAGIVAVAGDDDDTPVGQLGQIDVVDQARRLAEQCAAGEVVDVQAGLLVCPDDQAGGGVRGIAPDRRIVRRIGIGRSHRLGFGGRRHLHRRQADRGGRGAGGKNAGERECKQRAHQNAYLPTSWNTGPASSASSSYSSKSRVTWSSIVSNLLKVSRFLPFSRLEPTARIVKLSPKRFSTNISRSAPYVVVTSSLTMRP